MTAMHCVHAKAPGEARLFSCLFAYLMKIIYLYTMKNKECPYCHKQISFKAYRQRLWYSYGSIQCDHCKQKVDTENTIPAIYWIITGVVLGNFFPWAFHLYFHLNMLNAILLTLLVSLVIIAAFQYINISKMKFRKQQTT